jgi:hypothetical protein
MPEAHIAPRPTKPKKPSAGLPPHLAAAADLSSADTVQDVVYEAPEPTPTPEPMVVAMPAAPPAAPSAPVARPPATMREVYEMEDATHRRVLYEALGIQPEQVDYVRRQLVAMRIPMAGLRGPPGVLLGASQTSTTVKLSHLEHRCFFLAREAERQQLMPPGVPSPGLFVRAALQKYYALYGPQLEERVGPAVPLPPGLR